MAKLYRKTQTLSNHYNSAKSLTNQRTITDSLTKQRTIQNTANAEHNKIFKDDYEYFTQSAIEDDILETKANTFLSKPSPMDLEINFNNTFYEIEMNSTNALFNEQNYKPYELFLVSLLCVLILVTLIGNTLIIMAVMTTRRLRTVTNCFVMSLAVADWLVGIFVMPPAVALHLMGTWELGWILCDIWLSLDILLCTASILSLCAISVDRYLAVTRPLSYSRRRRSKRLALGMILVVWLVAGTITCPPMFGWYEPEHNQLGECRYNQNAGYVVFSAMGSFFLPAVVMVYVYARISRVVARRHRQLSNPGHCQKHSHRSCMKTESDQSTSTEKLRSTSTLQNREVSPSNLACPIHDNDNTVQNTSEITANQRYPCCFTPLKPNSQDQSKYCTRYSDPISGASGKPGSFKSGLRENLNSSKSRVIESEMSFRSGVINKKTLRSGDSGSKSYKSGFSNKKSSRSGIIENKRSFRSGIVNENKSKSDETNYIFRGNSFSKKNRLTIRTRCMKDSGFENNRVSSLRRETKTAQTLSFVVGGFIACWLPFFVYYIIMPFIPETYISSMVMSFLTWLGWFNSAINPFIYAFYSHDFRDAFWRLTIEKCKR